MKVFVTAVIFGLPLVFVLAWAFELTPEGIKRREEIAPNESIRRKTGRKLTLVIVLIAVIAAGLLVFQFKRAKHAPVLAGSSTLRTPATALPVIPETSIAMLPFENPEQAK